MSMTTTSALLLNSQKITTTYRRPDGTNRGRTYSESQTLWQRQLGMTTTTIEAEQAGAGEEEKKEVSNTHADQKEGEETPPIETAAIAIEQEETPLYLNEGLFAVQKPLDWTSQDVVAFIRRMLERDAKERGAPDKRTKKRNPWMKVGHGGTLDPLATGVLVVGVGKGTKQLQQYLVGTKGYQAGGQLGFQTTTLDMDPKGHIVDEKPFQHVTIEGMEAVLPQFRGTIEQIPPIFRYV
jgi:tRNA pseudouridine55 synthase